MTDFVPCEDDCCAAIADALFGKCKGTPLGNWIEVLEIIENCEAKIGIIDDDNNQIEKLKKYNHQLIYDSPDFKIYKKKNRYIIVLINYCEEFLNKNSKREKIRNKNFKFCPKQEYKIKLIRQALRNLKIL